MVIDRSIDVIADDGMLLVDGLAASPMHTSTCRGLSNVDEFVCARTSTVMSGWVVECVWGRSVGRSIDSIENSNMAQQQKRLDMSPSSR